MAARACGRRLPRARPSPRLAGRWQLRPDAALARSDEPAALKPPPNAAAPPKENEGYDDTFVEFLRAANAEPLSAGERRALKEAIALAAQVEGEDVDADGVKLPDE